MTSIGHTYSRSNAILFTLGILLLCLCTFTLLLWTNNARLLNLIYPFLSMLVGGLLYVSRPSLYVGFTLWIWFLSPFIRRIVDYQVGVFSPVSLVLLTPFLVTCLSAFSMLRFFTLLKERFYQPFAFMLLGVLYAYIVGLTQFGWFSATFNLIEWICPLFLGFHVLVNWRSYPEHRKVLKSVFTFGVIVMGTYGILQFLMPLPWDAFWMESSGMASIGRPEPYRVRVFSTLNAPGPFAMAMMAGLLLLFDGRSVLSRLALLPGYAAFLLSIVRGAWGGWVLALLVIILNMTGAMRKKLIGVMALAVVLLMSLQLFNQSTSGVQVVRKRLQTMANLHEDGSFQHRIGMYQKRTLAFVSNPVGEGLGFLGGGARTERGQARNLDSGILTLFASLGWPGTGLYVIGGFLLVRNVFRRRNWKEDQFALILGGTGVAYLVLMIFANQVISLKGVILWVFLSLALASRRYHREHIEPLEPDDIHESVGFVR